jgi:2-keto-4-pentenoate hydratase/2-oxohepta-3-ene-1,7-dioic acid hydratase in catechol pathway
LYSRGPAWTSGRRLRRESAATSVVSSMSRFIKLQAGDIVSTRTPTSCRHGAKTSGISKHRRHPVPFRGARPSCSRNHRFVQMLPQRLLRASDRAD